uniref:Interleukin 17 receptor B n=1 Tax=Sphenodon punctatus TaxID=8508 RepID=A0A8D0LCU0_SPHPU
MELAARLLFSLALTCGCSRAGTLADPSVTCGFEPGPALEWRKWHNSTPADLNNLSAEFFETRVGTQFKSYQINISWSINADASIRELTATKICIQSEGTSRHWTCIRCNYTEKFQSQTTLSGQRWQFHYAGLPVEPSTHYFISAHNLPPANLNEDSPSKSFKLTSPDCEDNVMKYSKSCIAEGSLWNPSITVCKTESEVEVNFTTSILGKRYTVLLYECEACRAPIVDKIITTKINDTRISVRLQANNQSNNIVVKIIPYFPKCGNDCPRHMGILTTCIQKHSKEITIIDSVGRYVFFTLLALFLTACLIAMAVYFMRNHDAVRKQTLFHPAELQSPLKVLVIYQKDMVFHHTVLAFAEFLREQCRSDVIIDMWQKRKIAEVGPVQWLATQKEVADKVIFLNWSHSSTECDVSCNKTKGSSKDNSECMFTLAFNLFCCDLKNQSSLHKYMVVSFNELNTTGSLPGALNTCPKYCLMKDIDSFCRDLSLSQSQANKSSTKLTYRKWFCYKDEQKYRNTV